jgi:metal-responsive CopG/Arc/MetJ family transcriptional regulator
MKTAISLPDHLFKTINSITKKKRMSRSKFIANAVEEYLDYHHFNEISEKLNQIYAEENSALDKDLLKFQLNSLYKDDWK